MTASHTCSDRRPYIVLTSARLEQAMKDERDKFEGVTTMVNYYVKAQKQLAEGGVCLMCKQACNPNMVTRAKYDMPNPASCANLMCKPHVRAGVQPAGAAGDRREAAVAAGDDRLAVRQARVRGAGGVAQRAGARLLPAQPLIMVYPSPTMAYLNPNTGYPNPLLW